MSGYERDFEQGDRVKTLISSLFQKLNRILEKKSALFWHIKSLDRYSKEKINPLGLRVQIFPNLDQISTECKREWEANLNACSQEMMAILTREYNKQMVLLDTEIDNIEVSLDLSCNTRSIWSCRRTFRMACRPIIGASCRKKSRDFGGTKLPSQKDKHTNGTLISKKIIKKISIIYRNNNLTI